jgi:uncharacterized membrane protein
MYNLHPPLSAFPIVLLVVVVVLELVAYRRRPEWRTAIEFLLVLSVVATVAAFFSGYQGSDLADQTFRVSDEVIAWHHTCGRLVLFLVLPCAALRFVCTRARYNARAFAVAYGVVLTVCVGLVLYTGYLGGQLVFAHGAGVYAPLPMEGAPAVR